MREGRECVEAPGCPVLVRRLRRSFVIQRQQPFQDFRIGQSRRPAVCLEDCFVQLVVGISEPSGTFVVQIRKGAICAFFLRSSRRIQPGIPFLHELASGMAIAFSRGSSFRSWPGGHGNGNVSNVEVGVYRGLSSRSSTHVESPYFMDSRVQHPKEVVVLASEHEHRVVWKHVYVSHMNRRCFGDPRSNDVAGQRGNGGRISGLGSP